MTYIPEPKMEDILASINKIIDRDNRRFEKFKSAYDSYFPYVFKLDNYMENIDKETSIQEWLNNNFEHYNTKNKKYRKIQLGNYSLYYFQNNNMAIQFKLVWC